MADITYKTFDNSIVDKNNIKNIVDKFIQIVNDKNADVDTSDVVEAECLFFSTTYSAAKVRDNYYIHLCKADGHILFLDWYVVNNDIIDFECRYHDELFTIKTCYSGKDDEISVNQHSAY